MELVGLLINPDGFFRLRTNGFLEFYNLTFETCRGNIEVNYYSFDVVICNKMQSFSVNVFRRMSAIRGLGKFLIVPES